MAREASSNLHVLPWKVHKVNKLRRKKKPAALIKLPPSNPVGTSEGFDARTIALHSCVPSPGSWAHPLVAFREPAHFSHSPDPSSTPSVNSSQGVIKPHTSCLFRAASKTQKGHGYILPWSKWMHPDQTDPWKP